MTLQQACAILTARHHCDAEWAVAFNGLGAHAHGVTPGRLPNVNLSAEDAVRLAMGYEGAKIGLAPGVGGD